MRNFKLCLFLATISAFLYGKPLKPAGKNPIGLVLKAKSLHANVYSVSGATEGETPLSKRKYKPKGVEVDMAHIQNLLPDRIASYTDYSPAFHESAFISLLYCTDHKRGPPKN